jgi:hypothetical protein
VPKVSQKTDVPAHRATHEPHRVISIVRDGEGIHGHFANIKRTPGAENAKIEFCFELKFNRFLCESIAVNRDRQFIAERAKAIGVIRVFVREEDAIQIFRGTSNRGEAFANLARAKTRIDQETGVACLQICAITIGTAAQNRELNRHEAEVRKLVRTVQRFNGKNLKMKSGCWTE